MKSIIVMWLCLFCVAFAEAQGKLVIIGGGRRPTQLVDRIIEEARLKIGGFGIILPMASEDQDSAIWYARKQFIERGIENVYGLVVQEGTTLSDASLDSISKASLIYISGGDQVRFMNRALKAGVVSKIREAYAHGATIAGTSAGAAVMSRVMITGNQKKLPSYEETFSSIESNNVEVSEGLALLSQVVIDQHFVRRSRYNRLITSVIEYPELLGIGIDEATAIVVKGSIAEVVGESQVIVIQNKRRSKNSMGTKLGARNLSLDVYLPGESFSISTRIKK